MLLSSNHGHHASMPYDQMHGFDASSSSSVSGYYSVSGRPRGHGHSVSTDSGRPRSASSMDTSSSSRTSSHVGSKDTALTDEQRLSTLRQQQAQRRPKMVRLTPAVKHLNSSNRSLSACMAPISVALSSAPQAGESSRPASVVGIASITGYSSSLGSSTTGIEGLPQSTGLTIMVELKAGFSDSPEKILFPMVGSPPVSASLPLHPGSRRALAQKAGLQPAGGASLQLDLGCISGPSVLSDTSASANSASTLPELVRKKSGEPVKSSLKHFAQSAFMHRADSSPAAPASFHRAKSVPTTPTSSKAVHFDPVLEHVKVFKHRQKPLAVSRDGSPEHTETETEEEREFPFYQNWRKHVVGNSSSPSGSGSQSSAASTPTGEVEEQLVLRLPNFPSSAKLSVYRPVFLERVYLSDDLRSVKGAVQVQNLAFEKWLAVRFSLDNWATVCEVTAEHAESIKGGKSDRFTFSIKLNELLIWTRGQEETKTMLVCLRYTTAGQEFWDNNEGANYQLDFRKRPVAQPQSPGQSSRQRAETLSAGMTRAATSTVTSRKAGSPGLSPSELGSSGSRKSNGNSHKIVAEELGRSLEKLQTASKDDGQREGEEEDDNDEDHLLPKALRLVRTRRRSPPVSPGDLSSNANGRSSSPSMWQSRYDLSESLKNPKTGSRTTSAGRQAALDYFSAKPPAPAASQQQRAVFIGSSSSGLPQVSLSRSGSAGDVFSPSESGEGATPGPSSQGSSDGGALPVPMGHFTTKAGMISPGLGEVIAHMPMAMSMSMTSNGGSRTPSPSTGGNSPTSETAVTPEAGTGSGSQTDSPTLAPSSARSQSSSRSSMHTKFYSYPVHRNSQSSAGQLYRITRGSDEQRPSSPLARSLGPPTIYTPAYAATSGLESPVKKDRTGTAVLLSSSFLNDSPQNSPISPLTSPNPFSPTLSISSLESEMTTCLASPEDAAILSGSSGLGPRLTVDVRIPDSSVEDIHRSLLAMARGDVPGSESNSSHAGSGSPTLSAVSDSSSSNSSMKPGSVSSYDELIARFCWHDTSAQAGTSTAGAAVVASGLIPPAALPAAITSATSPGLVEEGTPVLPDANGHGDGLPGMHLQHVPHRMFASSMGSPTTESGSTTPTIGF
ncbi:unnamed protein product [Tilletia controversa]|nr:unnamed protein product [Tilletia controversa]CAD6967317.1 unnamed protein product [Tilletia controversa]CAD6969735.1 unnamed protein product [Tilletia controversa]